MDRKLANVLPIKEDTPCHMVTPAEAQSADLAAPSKDSFSVCYNVTLIELQEGKAPC